MKSIFHILFLTLTFFEFSFGQIVEQNPIERLNEALAQKVRPQNHITIHNIYCSGTEKTSCIRLQERLGIKQNTNYSEEDLKALNIKLRLLDYYENFLLRLEPLKEYKHANLIIEVKEKSTSVHSVAAGMLGVYADIDENTHAYLNFLGYNFIDHNFLGRSHYFNFTIMQRSGYDFEAHERLILFSGSVEYVIPLGHKFFVGAQLSNSTLVEDNSFLSLGHIGRSFSKFSTFSLLIGNLNFQNNIITGFRYKYQSQEHDILPVSGSYFEFGINPKISIGPEEPRNQEINVTDSTITVSEEDNELIPFTINYKKYSTIHGHDFPKGVITFGVGITSLPIAFGSVTNNNFNQKINDKFGLTDFGATLKYSLVNQDSNGKRSSFSIGFDHLFYIEEEEELKGKFLLIRPQLAYNTIFSGINIELSLGYYSFIKVGRK